MNANAPLLLFFPYFFCLRSIRDSIRTRIEHLWFVLANKSFSLRGRSSRAFFWAGEIDAECLDKFYLHKRRLLAIVDRRRNFFFPSRSVFSD